MKTTIAMLLVLLFVFSSKSSATYETDPVLDSNGEELRPGVKYYVVSTLWGFSGGGLTLREGRNQTCPDDVFLERNDRVLTFSPVDTTTGVIYKSTDLYIKLMHREATGCPQ